MHNKGFTKFLAVVFALICMYQLAFTWMVKSVESDAKAFANGDYKTEQAYLDSMPLKSCIWIYLLRMSRTKLNLGLT